MACRAKDLDEVRAALVSKREKVERVERMLQLWKQQGKSTTKVRTSSPSVILPEVEQRRGACRQGDDRSGRDAAPSAAAKVKPLPPAVLARLYPSIVDPPKWCRKEPRSKLVRPLSEAFALRLLASTSKKNTMAVDEQAIADRNAHRTVKKLDDKDLEDAVARLYNAAVNRKAAVGEKLKKKYLAPSRSPSPDTCADSTATHARLDVITPEEETQLVDRLHGQQMQRSAARMKELAERHNALAPKTASLHAVKVSDEQALEEIFLRVTERNKKNLW